MRSPAALCTGHMGWGQCVSLSALAFVRWERKSSSCLFQAVGAWGMVSIDILMTSNTQEGCFCLLESDHGLGGLFLRGSQSAPRAGAGPDSAALGWRAGPRAGAVTVRDCVRHWGVGLRVSQSPPLFSSTPLSHLKGPREDHGGGGRWVALQLLCSQNPSWPFLLGSLSSCAP